MTEEKSHRSIEIQYGILFIKNNKKCNIVSLFPALVIPKTYIVLICTVVPKDFQRSFLGSKLLLIACSVVEGIWGVGRTLLGVHFLEAPPSHSGHLCGGKSPFLLKARAPQIKCYGKATGNLKIVA